jgi:hypothetical protein
VVLADPSHSGSITATYNTILQRAGWEEGWKILRRCFANARYFTNNSSRVPVDVSTGEAGAGMCIDFYGRYQVGAVTPGRLGYVDPPEGMTAITADPISILRGAPSRELANEFVLWLLTPQPQQLWQKQLGTDGGPEKFELRRVPIRSDLYEPDSKTAQRDQWVDPLKPYELARPLLPGVPNYFGTVAPITHAIAADVHHELVAAWTAIQEHPDHPRRQEMLRLFDQMPPALEVPWPEGHEQAYRENWRQYLADPEHPRHEPAAEALDRLVDRVADRSLSREQQLRRRLEWTEFFVGNYRQIVRIAQEGP